MATKILYVITKPNWGGAQRYVYDLATAAHASGAEVMVAVGGTGPLTEKLTLAGVRVISLPLRQNRNFLADLLTTGSLIPLIRLMYRERPNVVHLNSAKAGGLGALAATLTGVPLIIFTAHGWEFNAPRNIFSKLGIAFFSWLTLLFADKTIAVSEAVRHDVRWWPFVGKRIHVVHNGIEFIELLSREKARAALAPHTVGKYWVGMLSELTPVKRVEDAIRAFSYIVPKHPEALLLVLGEGKERFMLERLVSELHLQNHVVLLGFVPQASSLLKAFNLFLHTSDSEALGYAILEAGYAGVPVVATRVGGIPEIIPDDDHGLLVPPREPEQIAKAIESLIGAPQHAAELGARLHARVIQEFSKEKMICSTFELYH